MQLKAPKQNQSHLLISLLHDGSRKIPRLKNEDKKEYVRRNEAQLICFAIAANANKIICIKRISKDFKKVWYIVKSSTLFFIVKFKPDMPEAQVRSKGTEATENPIP